MRWGTAAGREYISDVDSGGRDPAMDSMRFIAVVLVVVFHFFAPISTRGGILDSLYYATWVLRVPLLIFVSGWFSSAELPTRRSITRLFQSIVVVYLLFELMQRIQIYLLTGVLRFDWEMPVLGMWFLLTIGTLRVLLPYLVRIRWFGAVAVLASLLVGFTGADQSFSASHSVALAPLFLLGWYARQSGLRDALRNPPMRALAMLVLVTSTAAGWLLTGSINRRMVGMYTGYRGDRMFEFGMRGILLIWAAATVLAVMALIPRGRIPLVSACGAGSMYAYLLHQLVQRQWLKSGGPSSVAGYGGVALLGLAALALAIVLMLPSLRRWFKPIVQPRWQWFLRAETPVRKVGRSRTAESEPELALES